MRLPICFSFLIRLAIVALLSGSALAQDFPRLWHDPQTPDRERKRMARLLIADVTLLKAAEITAQVRFHGSATHTLRLPLSKPAWLRRQTSPSVVTAIDALLDDYTDAETAEQLNDQGFTAGEGGRFHATTVARLRTAYALRTRYARLRARGLLTQAEIAERLVDWYDTVADAGDAETEAGE